MTQKTLTTHKINNIKKNNRKVL